MKNILNTPVAHGLTRREGLVTLLGSALALTLAGCGGGDGGVAGLSSGGTGSFSVGPITGFGSIIVNGVRYDDSGARVSDDDGVQRNPSELKLGMVVSVTGSAATGARATASAIVFGGELQGRIDGTPNTIQKTFVVLGQTVKVMGSTVFDASLANGFSSLATNTIVEVHGVLNTDTNTMQATFIEKKNNPALFKIQGRASSHDPVARKFNLGAIRVNYSTTPAAEVRVIPADGTLVRVRLTAVLPPLAAPAEWAATRIRLPENANENRDEAEIEGSITAFTSPAQFSVNGIAVSTSASTRFDDGTAGLAVGVRVEVKGRLSSGVLIAERVKIEDDSEVDNLEFELHGTVSNVTATTFEVRGVKVNYSGATEFRNGTAASLAGIVPPSVEVKGVASDSTASSTSVVATRISFE